MAKAKKAALDAVMAEMNEVLSLEPAFVTKGMTAPQITEAIEMHYEVEAEGDEDWSESTEKLLDSLGLIEYEDFGEEEVEEDVEELPPPPKKVKEVKAKTAPEEGKKKPTMAVKEPKKPKYTRHHAHVDAMRVTHASGEEIGTEAFIELADSLYVEAGGKTNKGEVKYFHRRCASMFFQMGIFGGDKNELTVKSIAKAGKELAIDKMGLRK